MAVCEMLARSCKHLLSKTLRAMARQTGHRIHAMRDPSRSSLGSMELKRPWMVEDDADGERWDPLRPQAQRQGTSPPGAARLQASARPAHMLTWRAARYKGLRNLQRQHFGEVKEGIVDFFNMVLGHGPVRALHGYSAARLDGRYGLTPLQDHTAMWQMLANRLESYFSYNGPANPDCKHRVPGEDTAGWTVSDHTVHPGALFISMQYHCGVRFADSPDYAFCSASMTHPFPKDSLLEVLPRVRCTQVGKALPLATAAVALAHLIRSPALQPSTRLLKRLSATARYATSSCLAASLAVVLHCLPFHERPDAQIGASQWRLG